MSTTFAKVVDSFRTTTTGRVVGATTLPLASGAGLALGFLPANRIFRITAVDTENLDTVDEEILTVLEATGLASNTLTGVTPAAGYNDVVLLPGTTIDIRVTAKDISELQDAINLIETSGVSGSAITALTGDVIAVGPGSVNSTLKTVNSNVGTFTLATIAVDAKGRITGASNGTAGTGAGTVTSVALALPAIMTVTGSPVTTSGTLTGALATQTANKGWFGPVSGAAAAPTFRALVAQDLPLPALGVYDVVLYGADPTGVADSTAAIQAAINACQTGGGGNVLFLPGTYKTTATLTVTGPGVRFIGSGIAITKILSTVTTTYVIAVLGSTSAPLVGFEMIDFSIDCVSPQTAGGALYLQYTGYPWLQRLSIGTPTHDATGYYPFVGIYLDGQIAGVVTDCNVFTRHTGIAFSGNGFQYGGMIRNCVLTQNHIPGSVGIHIGGNVGGPMIHHCDVGSWETDLLVDTSLCPTMNAEVFLGPHLFLDDAGKEAIRIAPNSCTLVHWTDVWCAGSGRFGPAPYPSGYPYGAGINIEAPNTVLKTVLIGGRIYAGTGSGIQCSAGRLTVTGLQIHDNGTGSNGGNAIDILGGASMDGVDITGCDIKTNGQMVRGTGVNITANTNGIAIVGNRIDSNAQGQIALASGCNNYNVSGNVLTGVNLLVNTPGAATTRCVASNSGIADSSGVKQLFHFGASGPIAIGPKPQTRYVDVAVNAYGLEITVDSGTVTAQIEKSTNGGSIWTTVDNISVSTGVSNTKSISASLTAGALLRVNYTAISGCTSLLVTLLTRTT